MYWHLEFEFHVNLIKTSKWENQCQACSLPLRMEGWSSQQGGILNKFGCMYYPVRWIVRRSLIKAWRFVWIWNFRHFGFTIGKVDPLRNVSVGTSAAVGLYEWSQDRYPGETGHLSSKWGNPSSLFSSLSDVCDSYQNELSPKIKDLGGSSLLKKCSKCSFDTTWTDEDGFYHKVIMTWLLRHHDVLIVTLSWWQKNWNRNGAYCKWWFR